MPRAARVLHHLQDVQLGHARGKLVQGQVQLARLTGFHGRNRPKSFRQRRGGGQVGGGVGWVWGLGVWGGFGGWGVGRRVSLDHFEGASVTVGPLNSGPTCFSGRLPFARQLEARPGVTPALTGESGIFSTNALLGACNWQSQSHMRRQVYSRNKLLPAPV